MNAEEVVRNKDGKFLTLKEWLPNAGIGVKGKWLCIDERGVTCQLSERELSVRGFSTLMRTL